MLLAPLTNYLFLRCIGGDKRTETSQETRYRLRDAHKYEQLRKWQDDQNSFWPSLRDLANPWTLAVVGCGLIGVVVEEVVRLGFDMR